MREIKFRAWDIKAEQIYFPNSYRLLNGGKIWGADLIMPTDKGQHRCCNVGDSCILMQFTGLKDKNGKEIYEGDIINVMDSIGFSYFEVVRDMKDWLQNYGYSSEELGGYKSIGVIGNIYENPELIKDGRK